MMTRSLIEEQVDTWQSKVEREYWLRCPASAALSQRATSSMPGGDTRYSVTLGPFTTYFASGSGARLLDVDDNSYLDFLNNATALIHGHAHPQVVEAVVQQVSRGSAWAGPNVPAVELAELLTRQGRLAEAAELADSAAD